MYDKRLKIFVIISGVFLLICLVRLTQMQLVPDSSLQDRITELKRQGGLYRRLKTLRGVILDRNGRVIAADEPQFLLHINYGLSCFLDERLKRARLLRAAGEANAEVKLAELRKEWDEGLAEIEQIIDKCTYFGLNPAETERRIQRINDEVWNLRVFQAWRENCPKSELFKKYKGKLTSVKRSEFVADFEKHFPNTIERQILIGRTDIAEMHKSWPLVELRTDDDIFMAQLEFMNSSDVEVLPKAHRSNPYGSVASQTIGWVGPPQEHDAELFAGDRLSRYLGDELCGRDEGVEYVCETLLRGRRGEVIYDIDGREVGRSETVFGKDVWLTLDIELQSRIESYLSNCEQNRNCGSPTAAVVIAVSTGEILSLVSVPVFEADRIRYDYGALARDANEPLRNRTINKHYPPGSVIKPVILICGLESGVISADEVIGCPAKRAGKGWPSCWLYNRYSWMGHDDKWLNKSRNAIKGSCNIYFSRLADRIESRVLQRWLFSFGYGREILPAPLAVLEKGPERNLRQAQGQISTIVPAGRVSSFEQVPMLTGGEKRYFGIGQGNLRVTPLQVANAMAVISRGGLYKPARLFVEEGQEFDAIELGISRETLDIVRDGMSAVVNEDGGTAYNEFAHANFAEQGVEVYGKTGSTEAPEHAWFAGFAEDKRGRGIAIAVVVEGGQHGSSDAGPLARDIIGFCVEAGHLGQRGAETE